MEWMHCPACLHVHTRHYWTDAGLAELFRNANANQLADVAGNFEAKRNTWRPVVDKVVELLGGYRSIAIQDTDTKLPLWVDVGCGDGALVMTASDYGFTAVGLDARAQAVQRILDLGFHAHQQDFMRLDFDARLDVVSMMDVLEHMPYPREALHKASQILRPGGIIVISLPDLNSSSWKLMDEAQANPYWMEIEHHHNFSRTRLFALLNECGFEVANFSVPFRYKAQMEVYARRI
jgi:SAM-dependent methyltransferase